jgi:hypothetical protein
VPSQLTFRDLWRGLVIESCDWHGNVRMCHDSCHTSLVRDHKQITSWPIGLICSYFYAPEWTRTTTGENSPQGPQPHSPVKYVSARVQIVPFRPVRGRIEHIGRTDLGQRWATPELCQVAPSWCRASRCRTRVRAEHLLDSVFGRLSALKGETEHRQSPACHNGRREARPRATTAATRLA